MKRPSINVSAILLLLAVASIRAEGADGRDVTLSLSTDQARYYVGEPLHLRIRIKNESDQDVNGFFHLLPVSEQVSIWSRRNGGAFTKLDLIAHDPQAVKQRNEISTIRLPMKVPAGGEKQSEMYLTRTVTSTRVVLDESGVYEFYVECKLWPEEPPIWVRSDVLSVPVDPPTGQQREVLEAYLASDMPALLQFWPLPPPLEKESAERAASFLAKHPHGPYSDKVHAALLNGLKHRVVRKTASPEEIALYERLRGGAGTAEPNWSGGSINYRVGDRVTHDGFTWKCIQAHRSQPDWAPPLVPALWVKVPQTNAWDYPVEYALGANVTYQGVTYAAKQAHTSQAGWTPPNTPALWSTVQ